MSLAWNSWFKTEFLISSYSWLVYILEAKGWINKKGRRDKLWNWSKMGSKDVLFVIRGTLDLTLVKWTEKHRSPKCKLSEGVSFSHGVVIHPVACGMPTPCTSTSVVVWARCLNLAKMMIMTLTVRFYFNLLTRLHRKNSSSSKARTTTQSMWVYSTTWEQKRHSCTIYGGCHGKSTKYILSSGNQGV